jgi:tRNA pseudouridine38-40 synthase
MRNVKLTIQYDGTNYAGWQSQTNGRAIQDVVEAALAKVLNKKIRITAASRTDSRAHAACQVANFATVSALSNRNL